MRVNEKGAAMLMMIVGVAIIFLLIITGFILVDLSGRLVSRQLKYQGQCLNAAEAGIMEALSWFRRQDSQPVTTFDAIVDDTETPPINDSDDPSIGIVRNFEISTQGRLWGRYEVRETGDNSAVDVSQQRGLAPGTVWQIESTGIVFVNNDPTLPYDDPANLVLLRHTMRTEFRRLTITLPGQAAISALNGGANCTISNSSRVRMGGTGTLAVITQSGSGGPTISGGAQVTGGSAFAAGSAWDDISIFGVTLGDLASMPDTDTVDDFSTWDPSTMPSMGVTIIQGDADFTAAKPLTGSGLLIVNGNMTIAAGSNSVFNGIIYVTGNYDQSSPSLITGTVISRGTFNISGAGDWAEIDYSSDIVQEVQRNMATYRFARNPYLIAPGS